MAIRKSNPYGLLGERLRNLRTWLEAALRIYELRNTETVSEAKAEFLKWACEGWDDDSGDVDGALAFALESYIECGPNWTDDTFRASFHLRAVPAWELEEFYLLVSSALADHALSAYEMATKGRIALAAMLYADAVEAREHWHHMRGPAKARNKETTIGETLRLVEESFKKRELAIVRRETSKRAAAIKLANDPVQAAKAEAKELWKERRAGKHPRLRTNEQFAMECMRRWPDLTSVRVICGWCTLWNKEFKESQSAS